MRVDKLEQLREVLDGHSQLLITPHNDPEPDAISAEVSMDFLVAAKFSGN